jgi:hypothetical protein
MKTIIKNDLLCVGINRGNGLFWIEPVKKDHTSERINFNDEFLGCQIIFNDGMNLQLNVFVADDYVNEDYLEKNRKQIMNKRI